MVDTTSDLEAVSSRYHRGPHRADLIVPVQQPIPRMAVNQAVDRSALLLMSKVLDSWVAATEYHARREVRQAPPIRLMEPSNFLDRPVMLEPAQKQQTVGTSINLRDGSKEPPTEHDIEESLTFSASSSGSLAKSSSRYLATRCTTCSNTSSADCPLCRAA